MTGIQKGGGAVFRPYGMATAPKEEGEGDGAMECSEEHVQHPVSPEMQSLSDALKESESTIAELKIQLREK